VPASAVATAYPSTGNPTRLAAGGLSIVKIWITDGSGAPFADLVVLPAQHPGMLGGDIPYKGALDENVPVGEAAVLADGPGDCLVPEAEWCICFPEGAARFAADPDALTGSTAVVMQGMIEGKWLNRFGEDLAWKPASLGNNLLAQGPGIAGTLACLEDGGMRGEICVQYTGRAGRQALTAALGDLRGHNLLGLARAVFGYCREQQLPVEAVDCSARGPGSALAEDRRFLQQVMTAAGVTPPELSAPAAWRRLAPEIVKIAIGEGLTAERGSAIDLTVTAGADVVGRGQLRVRNN
jgi:hypothetical protein